MSKFIVTTTIQPPTEATIKYSEKPDWKLIVVGDKKRQKKNTKILIVYICLRKIKKI